MKHFLCILRARFVTSMKIFFRYPLNIIFFAVDPIIWLTPFFFMSKCFSENGQMTGFQAYAGNSDFVGFMVIGYMVNTYVNVAMWEMGFTIKEEMMQGVLESNWTTPANRIALMLSKAMFQFTVATVNIILTGFICSFLFDFRINLNMMQAVLYLIPALIGIIGLGLMVSSLVLVIKNANTVVDISSGLLGAFSGSFFPVKVLPKYLLVIALSLPLTYLNDSLRTILIGQTPMFSLKMQFLILLVFMVGFFALGSFMFTRVERRCRMKGTLSGH